MALSHAKLIGKLAIVWGVLSSMLAIAAPTWDRNQPIQLDAQSSDFDYKSGTLAFQSVHIVQGGFSIEADHANATGLDFKDSEWRFSGHVSILTPDGSLSSTAAKLTFRDNAVSTAHIDGTPAAFEQKQASRVAKGHAEHIDYDFNTGQISLNGDAWLTDGANEISGHTLVYDLREQHIRANQEEQNSQRIHITINPRKPDKATP
jgi:lipopolysaccharide transport protein LptA